MGRKEFGQMIEAARLDRGWTRSKLAAGIGILPDGSALDATQVRRLVEGGRVLDPDLIRQLIKLLDLDPARAWEASGLLPPEMTAEDLRAIWERQATRAMTAASRVASRRGGRVAATPVSSSSEPEDLMRSCAPPAGQRMREAA
jgi:transcriptional regulator with XRE-family HTH domain